MSSTSAKRIKRTVLLALGAAALLLQGANPSKARADLAWTKCVDRALSNAHVECATIPVPIDRSGRVPGTINLRVARHITGAGKPWLVYLSGGPGSGAVAMFFSSWAYYPALIKHFNLITFDQRGTGLSGALDCKLDSRVEAEPTGAISRCAKKLGAAAPFYTTRDSVEDLEQLRAQLGLGQITPFGVSYGTKLALTYAQTYPQSVGGMLLDGVADPDRPDPFWRSVFTGIRSAFREACSGRCRNVAGNPIANLERLTQKLRKRPGRAITFSTKGRPMSERLTVEDVFRMTEVADFVPRIRSFMALAVKSALRGDLAPMLRLKRISREQNPMGDLHSLSPARYFATNCEETAFPWRANTPFNQRLNAARRAIMRIPARVFSPFDRENDLRVFDVKNCAAWPQERVAPRLPIRPYLRVRTLILQGSQDTRTPPEASARVARMIPGAQRLVVRRVGHVESLKAGAEALTGYPDAVKCGLAQLDVFLDGGRVKAVCPAGRPMFAFTPQIAPASFRELGPARGVANKKIGQTVTAIRKTIIDASEMLSLADANQKQSIGGLHGGSARQTNDTPARVRLNRYSYVPGVVLSGRQRGDKITVQVGGRAAARGRVTFDFKSKRVVGRLGDKKVNC